MRSIGLDIGEPLVWTDGELADGAGGCQRRDVDVSVLWLTGRQVPELLSQLIFGVFGFYFGRARGPAREAERVPSREGAKARSSGAGDWRPSTAWDAPET